MKKIKIIFLFLLLFGIQSCSTTQTILIKGNPGTAIYTPDFNHEWVIGDDGSCMVTLNSDTYYPFMLSNVMDSQQYIPFALDYNYESYAGTRFAEGSGMVLSFLSLPLFIGGGSCLIANDESNVGQILTAVSLGLISIGFPLGATATKRLEQDQQRFQFKYKHTHYTNENFMFKDINDNGVVKWSSSAGSALEKDSDEIVSNEEMVLAEEKRSSTFAMRRNLNIILGSVENIYDSYYGTADLLYNGKVIEHITDIRVDIIKGDGIEQEVLVNILEKYDVPFFPAPLTYKIRSVESGIKELILKQNSDATIKIEDTGKLILYHPSVMIDEYELTLKISALRK